MILELLVAFVVFVAGGVSVRIVDRRGERERLERFRRDALCAMSLDEGNRLRLEIGLPRLRREDEVLEEAARDCDAEAEACDEGSNGRGAAEACADRIRSRARRSK